MNSSTFVWNFLNLFRIRTSILNSLNFIFTFPPIFYSSFIEFPFFLSLTFFTQTQLTHKTTLIPFPTYTRFLQRLSFTLSDIFTSHITHSSSKRTWQYCDHDVGNRFFHLESIFASSTWNELLERRKNKMKFSMQMPM